MENIVQKVIPAEKPVRSIFWFVFMIIIYGWLGSLTVAVFPVFSVSAFLLFQYFTYPELVSFIEQNYRYVYVLFALLIFGEILGIRYGVNDVFKKSIINPEQIPKIVLGIALLYAILYFPKTFSLDLWGFLRSVVQILAPSLAAWYFLRQKILINK